MSRNLGERLLEILKQSQKITGSDIEKILSQLNKKDGMKLKDILVKMGYISEKELLSLISMELKIPFLNLSKFKIDVSFKKIIPEKLAKKHQVVPISKIGDTLTLAMADPFNVIAVDDISLLSQSKIDCVISTEKDIVAAIEKLYSEGSENINELAQSMEAGENIETIKDAEELMNAADGDEAPIVKIVDAILKEALRRRASDIHIEPFEKRVRVRYRIDGTLEEVLTIPKKNQNAVLTRLKIMSKLDITENRIPQDGRFKIKLQNREVDFRVSILPVHFGGKVVMRILDKGALSFGLDHLGFLPETLHDFKEAITKPFGMILITGPTGSGKSTTLYSILSQLNSSDKNLITVEDPIEYQVKGITQIQTRSEIGFTFASGLRAILRQSPDVVMVGEIRDSETADIAIKASLTGQIVLSTLHTNDAAGAMTRLMDMGVEPFLIASSVVLVAAQRLCRKVCPFCKEKIDVPREVFQRMQVDLDKLVPKEKQVFYKGRGCEKCNKTGYYGRMGVLETLLVDDRVRDLIVKRASSFEIKDYCIKRGMSTLREDAIKKCCLGLTTIDEVIRVTSEDD